MTCRALWPHPGPQGATRSTRSRKVMEMYVGRGREEDASFGWSFGEDE